MDNKSFDEKRIADGYAKDRPWLHKQVIERIASDCAIDIPPAGAFHPPFQNGLDVGCGAGLSTKALKLICDKVTGTDISEEMIRMCQSLYGNAGSNYSFYTAKAEETPIPQCPYDIVTAAGVINWVDKDKFLENMRHVMAKDALLVIYDFAISDQMLGNKDYTEWYRTQYLNAFPKPPRNEAVWRQDEMPEDFIIQKQVNYQLTHEFDIDSFIRFMMIQSNVNAKIKNGDSSEEDVRNWMYATLGPIFAPNPARVPVHTHTNEKRTLIFNGYSWYIYLKNKQNGGFYE